MKHGHPEDEPPNSGQAEHRDKRALRTKAGCPEKTEGMVMNMKQIIWVSILLAMAAIIMPVLFIGENAGVGHLADEPSPSPSQEVSPAPTDSARPSSYLKVPDDELTFTVLDGENIKDVTMAEYMPYVLAAEVPATFSEEALKAQAVAARTYILYCTEHTNAKHPQADICTAAGCCMAYSDETVLRGVWGEKFEENLTAISKAVTDSDGQVLTYLGEPILASFHSSSSTKTESGSELWGDVPYLVSVNSPETENDVPNFVTTVEVSKDNFKETVLLLKPEAVFSEDPSAWITETELDESGRVRSMTVSGTVLTGAETRKLFSLRSTAFTVEYQNSIFVFTVKGYGHGLGMSQYGANVMAKNGFDYREILVHYYPETDLS